MTSLQTRRAAEGDGVLFPIQPDTKKVSTAASGKQLLAASVASLDSALVKSILDEKRWRERYADLIGQCLAVHSTSDANAYEGAKAGLDFLYREFRYKRGERVVSLQALVDEAALSAEDNGSERMIPSSACFSTSIVIGKDYQDTTNRDYSPGKYKQYFSPELYDGEKLISAKTSGKFEEDIDSVVSEWHKTGVVEESVVRKIRWVLDPVNQERIDANLENTVFVVIGANSALGPYSSLLTAGNVSIAAVDLPRKDISDRLIKLAEDSSAKVYLPRLDRGSEGRYGANVNTEAPELIRWLIDLEPNKVLVLGCYAYADGANFVKVSAAMDVISMAVAKARGKHKTAFSYLMSPTDVFYVTDDIVADSKRKYEERGAFRGLVDSTLHSLSTQRFVVPNYPQTDEPNSEPKNILNNVVVQQGPNYLLAKRIQQWRSIQLFTDGWKVSSNIAPASSTESVVKNRIFKAAFGGSKFFGIRIFKPQESNSLMTLQLLRDIVCEEEPMTLEPKRSVLELFLDGCCHGGMFRCPYRLKSYVELALILYFAEQGRVPLLAAAGLTTGYSFLKLRTRSRL